MKALLSVTEARKRLLVGLLPAGMVNGEIEKLELRAALGRVLAEDVRAPFNLPLFDNSAMDGFAVRAVDVAAAAQITPVQLDVIADIPAGFLSEQLLGPGQAARIMTGAPLPPGADAVVPVENSDHRDYDPGALPPHTVQIFKPAQTGANVRLAGVDLRQGELLLPLGRRLTPQDIGV
ncbi:MAG: molybdopterin molybdenumtransferase MoeA, partial [Anaerolineales bacterium]|nr:molybdopterin molybdenumtransferase MoeA [Anaerolineales bacterium]